MLKNISPLISPSLLKILAEMGHGDEIVFSDSHFPGHTFNPTVLRADGLGADALLAAVIPLFELDAYATPVIMMARLPYGVPMWELLVSVGLLYLTFVGTVWLAGKIYRVGIFMYGKKPSFRELFKWVRYKY